MTTRSRRLPLFHCALLLAVACFGATRAADAAVTVGVASGQLRVDGDGANDQISLRLSADTLGIEVRNGATLVDTVPRSGFATIRVDAGGGNDSVVISESNGVFTDTEVTTIFGGDGNDSITGGSGAEFIHGDAGDDTLDPGRGNDTIFGEAGDDVVFWNSSTNPLQPSDGNDVFDGGLGSDRLVVTGSDFDEIYGLVPDAHRIVLTRSGGAVSLGLGGIEEITVDMRGGNDTFIPTLGLPFPVNLVLYGNDGNDAISGGEGSDQVSGGPGDDTVGGGPGNDFLYGGPGTDTIFGDAGNDRIETGPGNDTAAGGDGNDHLLWYPGDGNDSLDGESGSDQFTAVGDDGAADLFRIAGAPASGFMVNHNVFGGDATCQRIERLNVDPQEGNDTVWFFSSVEGRFDTASVVLEEGDDQLIVPAVAPTVLASGGDGHDTLSFEAMGLPVNVQASTIWVGGVLRVSHVQFEDVDLTGTAGELPHVTIITPTINPTMTSAVSFVALGGSASDADGGIQSVTWTNNRGGSGTAIGTNQWSIADVPVKGGQNVITVSAHDTSGNITSDVITVTVSELTYSLAEGATGTFFDLDVLIANPTPVPAPVSVTFFRQSGPSILQTMTLPPTSRTTLHVDQIPGLENEGGVSTLVRSLDGVALVVERTMFWDASYYGSHGGTAVDGPRARWLFAEGSEGFFNTFLLLANSGATASSVTLTFLREGSTPFTKTLTVPGSSRVTVAANGIPELVGRSFSIVVEASQPIIAERAMYFGTAHLLDGGHESAGVPEGATSWFLAEGATGSFFTTFVLIGNPNPVAANVTLTYLTATAQTVVRTKVVPANGRLTVNVATEDPNLASAAVSTTVSADQPVIAERAMYWPGPPSTWAEAHNGFGATTLGTKWGLGEGRVGMDHAFQTYILLANPSATAANVQITFLRADGTTVVKTFTVAPTSRFNVAVNTAAPELQNEMFGALIEVTNGVGISVERALYSDALGQVWAAGTNALGTRLP